MCTRALYVGSDNLVITGRTMDWGEDNHPNLWLFPRGMARDGASPGDTVKWTSRYGSLGVQAYTGIADGINEAGLVMNGLYLAESDYGKSSGRRTISIMAFGQYVLDSFGNVAEAVAGLQEDSIQIIAPTLPNGREASVHMSVSDRSADSAIFEWIDGKLVVHHGKQYQVMTNSPPFDQQLAIRAYWQTIDPLAFLPGSINAADRFVRASFFIESIPKQLDKNISSAVVGSSYENQAVASVLGVMRAVSVPLGVTHPTKPNISSTLWRTAHDQQHKVLYFDSATSPNTFWVPLADLDFTEGAPVKKLTLTGGRIYAGNAAAKFQPAEPFDFKPPA